MEHTNTSILNKKPGWLCEDCGTELGIAHLVGKRRKDRKVVCSKCVKKYKGEK